MTKAHSKILGSKSYKDYIKHCPNIEEFLDPSFILSVHYPTVYKVKEKTFHLNSYSYSNFTMKELLSKYEKEFINAEKENLDTLVFVDNVLVGTNKFIYQKYWTSELRAKNNRFSTYYYLIINLFKKGESVYSVYPLRTSGGGEILEKFFSQYFSNKGTFTDFGKNVLVDLIRHFYFVNFFTKTGFTENLKETPINTLEEYQTKNIMEIKEKYYAV